MQIKKGRWETRGLSSELHVVERGVGWEGQFRDMEC